MIVEKDETFSVGRKLRNLPSNSLSLVDLAEVYAYHLYQNGRNSTLTNIAASKLREREQVIGVERKRDVLLNELQESISSLEDVESTLRGLRDDLKE